ncbi:MAG: universal stress protein [Bacteroidota bacterium]
MKRILVPTDFSTHAEYALKVAAKIAKENDGEIFIVHMLELPSQMADAVSSGAAIPEIMLFLNKAHERLEELLGKDYLDGVKVTEAIKYERAFEGIIKHSEDYDIDMVIMGSHGASGFQEMLVGSTTEKIVRSSDAPVLIIKTENQNFNANRFVFASDFSEETRSTFERVLKIAKMFNSHLDLVMINTPNSFKTSSQAQKIMKDFISAYSLDNYSLHIYNDSNIETGIINFSNSVNADLIGMCTHGRTSLYHFFNGSISEGLVNHASKPVITFKI